ncbi:MAG: tRNA 2-thiouridine(34) synthase MnmA [Planctomycetaceae bacterium]
MFRSLQRSSTISRVVLAMSGGVDSSAAALLLQQQGHEVVGLFMRSGETEEVCSTEDDLLPIVNAKAHKQGCCSASDAADARRVADGLNIPFHAINFREEFGRIKNYFADEYLAGRTPNPCVMCNIWLKFGRLWEFAQEIGADRIASGHYAQVKQSTDGDWGLYRGVDSHKDQSYVLFGIEPSLLDRVLFPVGNQTKPAIRELARQAGIRTAEKPDSQEICFIPDNDYAAFLGRYRGPQETAGELVDTAGTVLGEHPGYERFTIGQRKGLGVTFGEPRFVVRIEPETNRVVIGSRDDLGRSSLVADRLNWLVSTVPWGEQLTAQIRYQHQPAACVVTPLEEGEMRVDFQDPQFGIAPGQAVVLYREDRVIGGGWIR